MRLGPTGPATQLVMFTVKLCVLLAELVRVAMNTMGTLVAAGLAPSVESIEQLLTFGTPTLSRTTLGWGACWVRLRVCLLSAVVRTVQLLCKTFTSVRRPLCILLMSRMIG